MSALKKIGALLIVAAVSVCAAATGSAQEFRGSISGRVTDNSGAAVANATVTIANTATNNSSATTTNENGDFTALYLIAGSYSVTVEAKGFKKSVRQNVEVRIGDKLQLNLQLEVGAVSETVNITSDAPLLDTNSATAGQVIDRRRISELPLSDGNPFTLTRLAPGIGYVGDLKFSRPFDNNGSSDFISNGMSRVGGHEFTLDGIPNTDDNGSTSNRVAFVPPSDAVQEFKIETASFDAQQGHGAGATVNVALRSGTNDLHGTVYEFVRNDVLSANDYFLNRTNLVTNPSRDKDKDGKADRDPLRYNRYGATVGGPITLPKKIFGPLGYDGRNRTFFFFAYERLKDVFPEPRQDTVPTLAERNGDFSALLAINSSFQIYNPFTGRQEGSRVRRDPFPGNIIPANMISPIAKAYLSYYPLPNQPGDAQGRNNFISGNPRTDTFHSESYRFDQSVSEKQKFFFRYTHNNRLEARNLWSGVVNSINPTGNFLTRKNDGFSYDHVYTFSPTTILDARIGFSRFLERNARPHEGQIEPASLGFSSQSTVFFGNAKYLPRFQISGGDNSPFTAIGDSLGDIRTHNIYAVQPTLTKIVSSHSFKMGYDFRSYRENSTPSGNVAGRYDFSTNYTRGPLDNSNAATIGQELASFLLGLPTGGVIDRNVSRSNQSLYQGIFFHDDWKLNSKLTLNLGLRYELEGATTERYNRNTRGFDLTSSSPIEAAAVAAYAKSPIPEIPVGSFKVKGGLLFADDNNRGFWAGDKNNFQPRAGFAYQLNQKTVLRGGFGMYMVPFVIDGVQQPGFSQSTSIVSTLNGGLTFAPACATCGSLFNPFPTGVLTPAGASAGLGTNLGQGITFTPLDRVNGMTQRWEFSVQRELPGQWLAEASYIGNRGFDLAVNTNILNTVPRQYLSTSPVRDNTTINLLTANVTNPFQNLIPGQNLNGATTSRQQLLRPFPQFTGITSQRYDGSAIYHAAQFRMERRFSRGFTFLTSYTWSKVIEEVSFLNESDTEYERRIGTDDIPHRIVISSIWEIPFGKGRKWGANWNGFVDGVIGGWQVTGIYQWQSGRPIDLGSRNVYFNADPSSLRANITGSTVDATFNPSIFYFTDAAVQTNGVVDPNKQRADQRIMLANNIRTFPSRLPGFRRQPLNLWDLSLIKNFSYKERLKFQLRGEFLNAFNHPQFGDPETNPTSSNIGKVTSQTNLPRNVQIGLKLIF
jgi:hypothetical protein